jgi:hypothetical protein
MGQSYIQMATDDEVGSGWYGVAAKTNSPLVSGGTPGSVTVKSEVVNEKMSLLSKDVRPRERTPRFLCPSAPRFL